MYNEDKGYLEKDKRRAKKFKHKKRIKNNRKHDFSHHEEQPLNKHVTTPKACSCYMCGNPRKYGGNCVEALTLQERKALDKEESFYNSI